MDDTRVFSYRRFSSGRQAYGHSLERQVESARRWCVENGYQLDESLALSDLGVSAYKGDNASKGALSGFLAAVEARKVPTGSILLVESLDRLSRAAIPEAVGMLTSIVRAGVRVISLIDGKEWNNTTIEDSTSFLLSVILFSRAHEESSTKAKRVSAAFQKKRAAGLPVVSIMHGPGWVSPTAEMKGWKLDKEKAKSVVRVFQLAAEGHGGTRIARQANVEGWPVPWRDRKNGRRSWEHTAVSRLLRDRRVLGEWQPKRMLAGRLVSDGDPIANYYPAAVSEKLWHGVQNALTGRSGPKRIRGVKADVFSGLLYCDCGARMERKAASSRGSPRYYCLNRKAGLTKCPPFPEMALIDLVLRDVSLIEQAAFRSDDESATLREQISHYESVAADAQNRADNLMAAIEEGAKSEGLLQRLKTAEDAQQKALDSLEVARLELNRKPVTTRGLGAEFSKAASKWITDHEAVEERHKLTVALNSVLKRIVWHGKFFFIYLKNGAALSLTPPDPTFKRAKRRDAGIEKHR